MEFFGSKSYGPIQKIKNKKQVIQIFYDSKVCFMQSRTLYMRILCEVQKSGQEGVGHSVGPSKIQIKTDPSELFFRKNWILSFLNKKTIQ